MISRKPLRQFWEKHPGAEEAIRGWFHEAKRADWNSPNDVKRRYPSASFVAGDRVVFNIKGNKYRLIVAIKYDSGVVFIRFVGTHAEYDRIDAVEV